MKLNKMCIGIIGGLCVSALACSPKTEQEKEHKVSEETTEETKTEQGEEVAVFGDSRSEDALQEILESYDWVNDFQTISIYRFDSSGNVKCYGYDGEIRENEKIRESWIPDPEQIIAENTEKLKYTIQDQVLQLETQSGNLQLVLGERMDQRPSYLEGYDGAYFLYEQDNEVEKQEAVPFYLFSVSKSSMDEETVVQIDLTDWTGVYSADDGDWGELYIITDCAGQQIEGYHVFLAESQSYSCSTFVWKQDDQNSKKAEEIIQDGKSKKEYTLNGEELQVNDPEGQTFSYICSPEEIPDRLSHPGIPKELSGEKENVPFYGIWIYASQDEAEASAFAVQAEAQGLNAQVTRTTQWSNLNEDTWYVVSAGRYNSQTEAEAALGIVQASGYQNAYVKYTGDWIG